MQHLQLVNQLAIHYTCLSHTHTHTHTHLPFNAAYGYGFLLVLLVSLLSLLGVILIPILTRNKGGCYLYTNALMIALGTSALFCSAILHLLPQVFLLLNPRHSLLD